MDNKYKINVLYGSEDLEIIFIKVLLKELNMICKFNNFDVKSSFNYLSLKEGRKN